MGERSSGSYAHTTSSLSPIMNQSKFEELSEPEFTDQADSAGISGGVSFQ